MSRSLGRLTLDLIAKIAGFTEPLDKATRVAQDRFKKIQKEAAQVGAAIGGMSVATATAVTAMVNATANATAELTKFSAISGSTVDEFQRYSVGANAMGTSSEKLADIFKDVNDKIGDFMQTGAGPMADFFEEIAPRVNVTAEQFKNLSGPQALGLYVDSLERAKVSQAEMTFYLEAIASDTTMLLPLLRGGGEGFRVFADEAERMGTIIDNDTVASVARLKAANWLLSESVKGIRTGIAEQLIPVLADISDQFSATSVDTSKAAGAGEIFSVTIRGVAASALGAVAAIDMLGKLIAAFAVAAETATDIGSVWENLIPGRAISNIVDNFGEAKKVFGDALEDIGGVADEYATRIQKIWQAGSEGGGGSSRLNDLAAFFEQMEQMVGGSSKRLKESADQIEADKKRIASISTSFQSIADRLDPATAALNRYNREQAIMFDALGAGIIDLQRFDELMSGLDGEFIDSLLIDVDAIGRGIGESAAEAESIYTGMWERIGAAGSDVFMGILNDADNSFAGIGDLFKRLLAEMANEALITPITLQFKEAFSGSGSGGGQGGSDSGNAASAIGAGGIWGAIAVAVVAGVNEHNKNQEAKFGHLAAEIRQGVQSTGTLLGMANAKSESIANLLTDMGDQYSDVLSVNHGMYRALLDIRAGLTGVASGFARSFTLLDDLNVNTGTTAFIDSGKVSGESALRNLMDSWGGGTELNNFVNGFLGALGDKVTKEIFKKKVSVLDSGIQIIGSSLADILTTGAVEAFSYADVQTKKKTFGITTSNKVKTQTESLGDLFESQLASVFENAADALAISSATYGIDFDAFVNRLMVDPLKLSLKDLEGEEITAEIERFLSSTVDGWAGILLAGTDILQRYQEVGEGAFETMVRLSTQTEHFKEMLGFVGIEFALAGVEAVKATQEIAAFAGGFDALSGSLSVYYDKFFTDAEKFDNLSSQLATATDGLLDSLPETTAQFRDIIAAIDTTTEAGQRQFAALINLSGPMYEYIQGLEKQGSALAEFMSGYEDQIANFGLSEFEQQINSLSSAFDDAIAKAQSLGASEQQLSAIRAASQLEVVRLLSTQTDNAMSRLSDSIAAQISTIQADGQARIAALQEEAAAQVSRANGWMQSQLSSYQRKIALVGESIGQLSGLSDAIRGAIEALTPDTQLSQLSSYSGALDRLTALTVTALSGGGLPTAEIINSLAGAMQGNEQYYSSYEDWIVATAGITANLDALAGVTETQLTADEKMLASLEASMAQAERHNSAVVGSINSGIESQIAAINAQMEADIAALEQQQLDAEEQIAAMRGIDTSVLSVEDAVRELAAAMQSEAQNRAQLDAQMNAELLQELRNMNRSNSALAGQVERLEIYLRNAS